MNQKPFQLGILVGRFQTLHLGHEDMVGKALALCERVGVFIGSSQEQGTERNPFSYEARAEMLRTVFGDALRIYPLPDIGVGNNARWGDYVLENVKERFGMMPDLLVSGKEGRRVDWFDSVEGLTIAELYIPKTVEVSASVMRGYLAEGNFEAWKQFENPLLWERFEDMQKTVLAASGHTETASI